MNLSDVCLMLKTAGVDNFYNEAVALVIHITGMSKLDLLTNRKAVINDKYIDEINNAVRRRAGGEPLQYITGTQEFMSLEFYVDKNVLIPRQDTETLVETVIDEFKAHSTDIEILDVCTGSGAIAVSLAHYLKNARVTAVDISGTALNVAEKNVSLNKTDGRVFLKKCDVLAENIGGRYDVIVSNPPYICSGVIDTLDTTVKDYEPRIALDGGADGLVFYRKITHDAVKMLKQNGMLIFEIGYDQGSQVSKIMELEGFKNVDVIKDYSGNDRCVKGRLS